MSRVFQNVVANLGGKAWTVLISLAVVPVYLRVLGIEAYGLMGVFLSLTAIFAILDLGLGNALNRRLAQLSVEPDRGQDMRDLLRTLEIAYWAVGISIGVLTALLASSIAAHWVRPQQLSAESVAQTIALMGAAIAVQWPRALYTGGLMGLQRQVLLNLVSSASATVLNLGGVLIVVFIAPTLEALLLWIIAVSFGEVLLTRALLLRHLPAAPAAAVFSKRQFLSVWRFAAGMTGITVMAVILGQLDKVILSKLLTLEAFGYYSLAWRVVSGLYLLVSPVQSAFFPRFSQLAALGDQDELARSYHRGSQLLSVVLLPVAAILALFSDELLRLWTLDDAIARNTSAILSVLAVGTAINGLMNLPTSLQLSHGWTRLVFMTNVVAVASLTPLLYFVALRYGGLGAAWIWLALNVAYVTITLQLMHRRLLRGHLGRWLLVDMGAPLAAALAVAGIARLAIAPGCSYAAVLVGVAAASLCTLLAAVLAAPDIRSLMVKYVADKRQAGARP
jgi:O-antigen/teichoic acid export membrane protein